jgi:hypothetical protein
MASSVASLNAPGAQLQLRFLAERPQQRFDPAFDLAELVV